MDMLYEARILEIQSEDNDLFYKIHYKGWKNTWDDWVRQDRLRKFNDENKELAHTLRENVKALQAQAKGGASARTAALKKVSVTGQRTGVDSSRGSEERTAQQATSSGRGSKRQRDHDLEEVCLTCFPLDTFAYLSFYLCSSAKGMRRIVVFSILKVIKYSAICYGVYCHFSMLMEHRSAV